MGRPDPTILSLKQCYSDRVMGMPELFRKVFMVDLIKGLGVTFRNQDPKEIYTEQYPLERPQVAEAVSRRAQAERQP